MPAPAGKSILPATSLYDFKVVRAVSAETPYVDWTTLHEDDWMLAVEDRVAVAQQYFALTASVVFERNADRYGFVDNYVLLSNNSLSPCRDSDCMKHIYLPLRSLCRRHRAGRCLFQRQEMIAVFPALPEHSVDVQAQACLPRRAIAQPRSLFCQMR